MTKVPTQTERAIKTPHEDVDPIPPQTTQVGSRTMAYAVVGGFGAILALLILVEMLNH